MMYCPRARACAIAWPPGSYRRSQANGGGLGNRGHDIQRMHSDAPRCSTLNRKTRGSFVGSLFYLIHIPSSRV